MIPPIHGNTNSVNRRDFSVYTAYSKWFGLDSTDSNPENVTFRRYDRHAPWGILQGPDCKRSVPKISENGRKINESLISLRVHQLLEFRPSFQRPPHFLRSFSNSRHKYSMSENIQDDMEWDDYNPEVQPDPEDDRPGPGDDPAVQNLEPKLLALFDERPDAVFYESQLAVLFERDFFHWVTVRALRELREGGKIGTSLEELMPNTPIRFYFNRRNRYWKRKAEEVRRLVLLFSDQAFTRSLGVQGELLVDAGLPRVGFQPMDDTVQSWEGLTWSETNHDLDRVFRRDGINYGAEIKNRLGYIPKDEFEIKLRMCAALNLVPLFIARMMPRTYIEEVRQAGGFSLIMKYQFYPLSHRALAVSVRNELGLPVDCPTRLEDSTLQRFLTWHEGKLRRIQRTTS